MDMTSMRESRRLPVGIQSFEEVRRGGYRYVDKTEQVWRLANEGKVFFLSRLRRFGKSLLVFTLEAFFQGRRDLFDGLAIQPLEDSRGEGRGRSTQSCMLICPLGNSPIRMGWTAA